jgi:hypothetical protein
MNKYGQLSSQLPRVVEFSLIPLDKVISVACGSTHTVVLVKVCLYEDNIQFERLCTFVKLVYKSGGDSLNSIRIWDE